MAAEVEIIGVSTKSAFATPLPTSNAVLGTTADAATSTAPTLGAYLQRNKYAYLTTAGSTYILSTLANIQSIQLVPTSSAAGTFTLADGTTTILSVPTAAHVPQPQPLSFLFGPGGITNTSTAGFKVTLGASCACLVQGAFVGAITTA